MEGLRLEFKEAFVNMHDRRCMRVWESAGRDFPRVRLGDLTIRVHFWEERDGATIKQLKGVKGLAGWDLPQEGPATEKNKRWEQKIRKEKKWWTRTRQGPEVLALRVIASHRLTTLSALRANPEALKFILFSNIFYLTTNLHVTSVTNDRTVYRAKQRFSIFCILRLILILLLFEIMMFAAFNP